MNPAKRLIITGAGSGIGLTTALKAARNGWEVFATVHTLESVQRVEDLFAAEGLPVHVSVLDVTDEAQCRAAIDIARPYALVNNAGVGAAGAIEDVSDAQARLQLEIMTVAPIRLANLAAPYMREQGGGRIINVSSLGGRTSSPLTGWYTASKHALESLSDALRVELMPDNIKVSLVEPGGVSTGILEKSAAEVNSARKSRYDKSYKRALTLTEKTLKFNGTAEKVAAVIVRAIDSPRPRSRYLVGVDARLLLLAGAVFPTWVKDRFKRRMLNI